MKANRVHRFGAPDVISWEDVDRPQPAEHEVLVRVKAAGVGPWDGWIRAGKSALPQPLPLTLGSDLSGIVETVGAGVTRFAPGDEVFGVTNQRFTGACAEYAVAASSMIARKPPGPTFAEAAAVPVVAVTAWQTLFEEARLRSGQRVLVHGAGGSVGAVAVQLARHVGARVIATAGVQDLDYVRSLGADEVIDFRSVRFEDATGPVDLVLDTVGGDTQRRSFSVLEPGGLLVSIVSQPDAEYATQRGVRAMFLLVEVTTARLDCIAEMIASGELAARLGGVMPLAAARTAHEMLEGTRPRPSGKLVLSDDDATV